MELLIFIMIIQIVFISLNLSNISDGLSDTSYEIRKLKEEVKYKELTIYTREDEEE